MIEKTALSCGVDIPFTEAQLIIHQPLIEEIAMIGEENFFLGCEILNTQKNSLLKQGNFDLSEITNFDILMSIMNDKSKEAKKQKNIVKKVLALIFPNYEIYYTPNSILFVVDNNTYILDKQNYDTFQKILIDIFMLDKHGQRGAAVTNPANAQAQAIADKINKAKAKIAKQRGEDTELFILGKYADILSVGLGLDRNIFNKYTVWQLYSAFDRYMAKYNWDTVMSCKLAGATKVEEVDNWMN